MILLSLTVAVGLAMDCLSVALGAGACDVKGLSGGLRLASSFGLSQSLMLLAGYLGGLILSELLPDVDHWAAFIMLFAVGIHMMYESARDRDVSTPFLTMPIIVSLSLATSLDALMAGISIPVLGINAVGTSILAGGAAFVFTLAGYWLGRRIGRVAGRWAGVLGGAILIGLGGKILLEHLAYL